MLKTTTETGDIGIFSIGPKLPAPATYHQPPRPRRRLKDVNLHPPRPRHHGERDSSHDDRKRLPSYRDTTSEIISLYGSDTQRSYSRSFSPSIDDSRRSYSLTTCSSQPLPSHKSFATFQSYSSAGDGQRPRSPFPYPTRLKRPGMRPCSPAMTDGGALEYCRMMEYDRSSQRTPNGPYKSAQSYGRRRQPPMTLRPDANRSTSSLPTRTSPGPYYDGHHAQRARTPGSLASWTPGPYNRSRRGSNEQSIRTTSLTSIVEMYQVPTNSAIETPLRPMGSFYYDYTEGFENQAPVAPDAPEPICPIPQRSDSVARPLVLSEEMDDVLESSPIHGVSSSTDRHSDESAALGSSTCLPSRESEEEQCECLPSLDIKAIEHEDRHIGDQPCVHVHRVAPLMTSNRNPRDDAVQTPDHVKEEMDRGRLGDVETKETSQLPRAQTHVVKTPPNKIIGEDKQKGPNEVPQYPSNTWAGDKAQPKTAVNQRASTTSASRLRNSLDPALAEFASMYASFDRLARSPFSKAGDDTFLSTTGHDAKRARKWPFSSKQRSQAGSPLGTATADKKSYRKRHHRNATAMKMQGAGLDDAGTLMTIESDTLDADAQIPKTPLQQFFANHQRKVKASAPQLMKPLPPLPAEAYRDANARVYVSESSRTGVPRLRLRPKPSKPEEALVEATSPGSLDEGPIVPPKTDTSSLRPRLRLKLSRAYLGLGSASKSATIVRSPGMKQCNALAEFQHCTRNDLFSPQISVVDAFIPPLGVSKIPGQSAANGTEDRDAASPQPSDQFDLAYPPTVAMSPETPAPQARISQQNSYVLQSGGKENRRLRQKISMLRLRIAGSHLAKKGRSIDTAPLFDIKSLSTPSLRLDDARVEAAGSARGGHLEEPQSNPSGRVKRWASNARHAVRLYVKKRLDRNSRVPSH